MSQPPTTSHQSNQRSSMLFAPRIKRRLQLRISERRLLLLLGDLIMIVAAILIALRVWAWVADDAFDAAFILPQLLWFVILPLLWGVIANANDFYNLSIVAKRMEAFQRLLLITLQMVVVYVVVFFFSDREALPRLFIIYYGIASFVLITLWRALNPALIGWAATPRRVLIIGTDWAAETIIKTLRQHAPASYQISGIIGGEQDVGLMIADVPVLGVAEDVRNYILRDGISEIVVTSNRELSGEIFQAVMDAYERGVVITPMPILYERLTERVPVEHVGSHWTVVLPMQGTSVFNPYPFLKRLMDVVLSLIGMVPFLLMLPLLIVVIKLDSSGSAFFKQTRVGLNGRMFTIIKLRTMRQNAEQETGAVFAQENDPRVTRIGSFMRRTRLDELPQLINVLRGDMSLIGPRPERPEHVERLQKSIPFYRTRHTVRPGVTGWAQVRYRYGADDHDALVKLQYDLYYIRHQSLMLDLNILIRTVGKVLKMAGR
jgi:exopolysaccharide biosynthesis polyprenyl glycosylphosphotransferase